MLSDTVRLPGHALESAGPLACAARDLAIGVFGIAPSVVESGVPQSSDFPRTYVVAAILAIAGVAALLAARIHAETSASEPALVGAESKALPEFSKPIFAMGSIQPTPTHAFVKLSRDRSIVLAISELEENTGECATVSAPRRHHHHH